MQGFTRQPTRTMPTWLLSLGFGLCACSDSVQSPSDGFVDAPTASPTTEPSPPEPSGAGLPVQPRMPVVTMPGMVQPSGGAAAAMAMAGSAAPSGAPRPSIPDGTPTYHRDIRPLIEARCLGCHVDGGSGPFALDTWDAVDPLKGVVVHAVETRRMPPWLADSTNCTKTRGDQRFTDAQIALFTSWAASDFPVGDQAEYRPLEGEPAPLDLGEPDLIFKARTPHQLTAGREYYVCLQVDTSIDEDLWVRAMDVVPDNAAYVHHAIVSVGSGSCSALGTTAENIYSYRPGSRTLAFEPGDALLLPAGSVIAIQFHYNTMFAKRGEALPADHSQFRVWTLPRGQRPDRAVARMPLHDILISIPVGIVDHEEGATATISSEYARPGAELIGISPHMHYLGQRFKETLRTRGETVCLVDIPDWNQDWQLDYFYDPADYIEVSPGDRLTQTCVYSNRPEDQGRDAEGNLLRPMYTTFGEDTRQEMCLAYMWFRYPLSAR